MEKIKDGLIKSKRKLHDVFLEAKRVERYVNKDDREPYQKSCKKAEDTISDLESLTENMRKMLLIREKDLDFVNREAHQLLSDIFQEIAQILKKYHGQGIPVDPIVIKIEIEVMDVGKWE